MSGDAEVLMQRATLLMQQGRLPMARDELHRVLAAEPDHARAHALLALCLSDLGDHDEAGRESRQAIKLAPDEPFHHYAFAQVFRARNRFEEAEAAIREAIRLDPSDADYRGTLAAVLGQRGDWKGSLAAADEGLALDPEHGDCTNQRGLALTQLGRTGEANAVIADALRRNPDDAQTHANQGWTLLHQGDHRQAAEHFRTALRLDPDLDWARRGMLEALKARSPFYRLMLRWFLWLGRLSNAMQWVVIIGIFVGQRILTEVRRANPELAPLIWPVAIALFSFVYLTWIASPLCNLLLRLDRDGRHVLDREETLQANLVGALLAMALGTCVGGFLGDERLWLVAIASAAIVLPVTAIFGCERGWPRTMMTVYTLVVVVFGAVAIGEVFLTGKAGWFGIFVLAAVVSTWIAAFLSRQTPTK